MRIKFNKSELLTALSPAVSIAPSKSTIDILGEILFECPGENPGEVRITAYDNEKGLRTNVNAVIINEGSFLINGQNLLQIVRCMPEGEIQLDIDENNRVKISGGSSVFEIASKSAASFPTLPLLAGDRNYVISKTNLKKLIVKTLFAVGQNASNPVLTGCYFVVEEGKLKLVGCDGTRLAYADLKLEGDVPDVNIIVPGKILGEVVKMLDDSDDEIKISVARKHIIFRIDNYVYFSRIIDGEYVNYKRIIPSAFERCVFVNRDALFGAIERASIVSEDKLGSSSAKTYLKLTFEEDVIKLSSTSTGGSAYDEIPASMTGDELIIGFNARMLLDAVKACDDCITLKISMNGPLMGICIENGDSDSDNDVNYLMFAMPLRMNGK